MPLVWCVSKVCRWVCDAPLGDGVYSDLAKKSKRTDFAWTEFTVTAAASVTAGNAIWAIHEYRNNDPHKIDKTAVLLQGALFTFLVTFRAGQSYNRWFEGRGHMGRIHASIRALSLYVNGAAATLELVAEAESDESLKKDQMKECKFLRQDTKRLLTALFRACILHVREKPKFCECKDPEKCAEKGKCQAQSLIQLLNTEEQKNYQNSVGTRPMFVLQLLIGRLARLNSSSESADGQKKGTDLESDYRMSLQEVGQIVTSFNGADKLVNTPSPNFYLYLLFLVYVYWGWGMLPWCLASYNHDNYWQSTVEGFLISYTFCFLVTLAIDMDNPFDGGMVDLPLEKYEAGLLRDLAVVLGIDTDGDGTIDEEVTHESNLVKSDIGVGSLEVISPRSDVIKKEARA